MELMLRTAKYAFNDVIAAAHDSMPVSGLTHCYYKYPARFSPNFVRTAIDAFSEPGDLIVDPFMGGGTTLVQAYAQGRRALGTDINSLAVFVTEVKTTLLSDGDFREIDRWISQCDRWLNLRNPTRAHSDWEEMGYHRNITGRATWRIRKLLELALGNLDQLQRQRQKNFVRCLLLRTAQLALDCKKEVLTAHEFRARMKTFYAEMVDGNKNLRDAVRARLGARSVLSGRPRILHRSAIGIETDAAAKKLAAPRLILTSPPYPGVHVLYHRWQINGRKESPAPYWIAGTMDGDGASFYTFGYRRQEGLKDYYNVAQNAYASLAKISDERTLLVQLVAFSDPSWQLPCFLDAMRLAGFEEAVGFHSADSPDGRVWRAVPNRKFYADQMGSIGASQEVLLVHRVVGA